MRKHLRSVSAAYWDSKDRARSVKKVDPNQEEWRKMINDIIAMHPRQIARGDLAVMMNTIALAPYKSPYDEKLF